MTAISQPPGDHPWHERKLAPAAPARARGAPDSASPGQDAEQAAPRLGATRASISAEVICGTVQVADALAILIGGFVSIELYINALGSGVTFFELYWLAIVLAAIGFVYAQRRLDGYRIQRLGQLTWQVGRTALVWGGTLSVLTSLGFAARVVQNYSRVWTMLFALVCFAALAMVRIGAALMIDYWTRTGRLTRAVAVVGAGELGQQIVAKIQSTRDAQIRIAGIFDDRHTRRPSEIAGCPVVGTTDDLVAQVRQSLIDEVVIALPLRAEARIGELVMKLRPLPVDLRLSLDPIAGVFPMRGISETASVRMIEIVDRPLKHWSGVAKWVEDKILGLALLALGSPMMALIALAIRLDSKGPALFIQERFGFNNNVIRVFKFRTMDQGEADTSGAKRTVPDDPRVTRVGRFLRRWSIDELPQLLNVVLGDMSLVGPRPHVMAMKAGDRLYHEAVGEYFLRHRVKPGMTGWAQVHGMRGEIDTPQRARERVDYDLWYIDNWSIWLDLKVLFMTLIVVLRRQNAY
ncbi:MAG TPA: undecaprenyl-phosphate glucose phosphotransferase [Stellaceae bacterium]|nr:undecaprenyl-phosphate glucose phosphotransferase [Stellaceae bacterium]